jgi:hypothetical protein
MYAYFISYSDEFGFGNIEIKREKLITSIVDLSDISRLIENHNNYRYKSVVVLNFQLLRTVA